MRVPWALAVASQFYNDAHFLEEWIEYHLLVGVEHFWLYDDSSTDHWREVLDRFIGAGTVEVIPCSLPRVGSHNDRQVVSFQDAVARARGRARWLALIDTDEFLLPRQDATVTECLERHFSDASAVYVNWRNFGPNGVWLGRASPILTKLTACAEYLHPTSGSGKSILRPEWVRREEIWYVHHAPLAEGGTYLNGDGETIPVGKLEPQLDGRAHDRLIRLNHYRMRDEGFFRSAKLALPRGDMPEWERWIWDEYQIFSQDRDEEIIDFIRRQHPARYAAFWGRPDEDWPALGPYVSAWIMGGLGNKLFQVAAASALAWDNGAEAVFPGLDASPAHYEHVFRRCHAGPDRDWEDWHEPSYSYSPIPFRPNIRLRGYFQSERYFAHHRERILSLFRPLPGDREYLNRAFSWLIDRPDTVGVPIRYWRGEFPDSDRFPQYGRTYLERAMTHFPGSPLFVVSSNDLEYARAILPAQMENVYVLEGHPDYLDLFVLSACRHQIIMSSTFGWWAAWLNQNDEKIVVRPSIWLKDRPDDDPCLPEWLVVEAPEE